MEAVAPLKRSHHGSTNHSPIFWDLPRSHTNSVFGEKKLLPALSCFFLPQIKALAHMLCMFSPDLEGVLFNAMTSCLDHFFDTLGEFI